MKLNSVNLLKLSAIAATAVLLAACGGGDDDGAGAVFATSTGAKTNGVNGQTLYNGACASCHGASMPAAVNAQRTLNAIAANKGGMGYLGATIGAAQADDIATYLAYEAVNGNAAASTSAQGWFALVSAGAAGADAALAVSASPHG